MRFFSGIAELINDSLCPDYGHDDILVEKLFESSFCNYESGNVACREEYGVCTECFCSNNHTIMSPNFPDYYPDNIDITWLIRSAPDQRIKINILSFSLDGFSG